MTHRDTPARHPTHSLPEPGATCLADGEHRMSGLEIGSSVSVASVQMTAISGLRGAPLATREFVGYGGFARRAKRFSYQL
jgi:hypothetical protein